MPKFEHNEISLNIQKNQKSYPQYSNSVTSPVLGQNNGIINGANFLKNNETAVNPNKN